MSWETVAQVVLIMFMASVFLSLLMAVFTAMQDARARRNIKLYEAGLMPKGWRAPK
jgi:hypothetical protein